MTTNIKDYSTTQANNTSLNSIETGLTMHNGLNMVMEMQVTQQLMFRQLHLK